MLRDFTEAMARCSQALPGGARCAVCGPHTDAHVTPFPTGQAGEGQRFPAAFVFLFTVLDHLRERLSLWVPGAAAQAALGELPVSIAGAVKGVTRTDADPRVRPVPVVSGAPALGEQEARTGLRGGTCLRQGRGTGNPRRAVNFTK